MLPGTCGSERRQKQGGKGVLSPESGRRTEAHAEIEDPSAQRRDIQTPMLVLQMEDSVHGKLLTLFKAGEPLNVNDTVSHSRCDPTQELPEVKMFDFKIFLLTFTTIFIAELGDKTQFAALAAGSSQEKTFSVWMGVVLGLAVAGTIGVFAGRLFKEWVDPQYLRIGSGVLFVVIGVVILLRRG